MQRIGYPAETQSWIIYPDPTVREKPTLVVIYDRLVIC